MKKDMNEYNKAFYTREKILQILLRKNKSAFDHGLIAGISDGSDTTRCPYRSNSFSAGIWYEAFKLGKEINP